MKKLRAKCLNCKNRVKKLGNKCCSKRCAGLFKRTRFLKPCDYCKKEFYVEPHRLENNRGRFCSIKCRSIGVFTPEVRLKMSLKRKGKPSLYNKGEKCHFWKGGVTPVNKAIRMSLNTRIWRESVFKRDNWTCLFCKKIGGRLQADHIKPFSLYPELRFAIDNGRTLCIDCHKTTDTYGGKINRR